MWPQIYAIRQSLSKALVPYYQKYVDEASKKVIKDIFIQYDPTPLVADPRPAVNSKSSEVLVPVLDTRNPTAKPNSKIRIYLCNKHAKVLMFLFLCYGLFETWYLY